MDKEEAAELVDEVVDDILDDDYLQPAYGEMIDRLELVDGDIMPPHLIQLDRAEDDLREAVKDWLRFRVQLEK